MATTKKKTPKKSTAKPRAAAKKSQPKQAENIQSLQRKLDESLEREAATSDILRMIARSPGDLQVSLDHPRVLNAIRALTPSLTPATA